jgi:hypothetical protein
MENAQYGAITQLVECHNGIVKVSGSNPLSSILATQAEAPRFVTGTIAFP